MQVFRVQRSVRRRPRIQVGLACMLLVVAAAGPAASQETDGRTRSAGDTGRVMDDEVNVLGGDSIGVIGGHQSRELLSLAEEVAAETGIICDYTYNDINHPQRLYYRSDHISFAVHDIPVLFYSTGIHRDYHQLSDTFDKIDYEKLIKVSRYVYLLGYRLASREERIILDHPYSTWH